MPILGTRTKRPFGTISAIFRRAAGLTTGSSSPLMASTGRQTAEGIDVAQPARHLVSVIEGLRWPLLFGAYTEREALEVLDAQLDHIFGTARHSSFTR